MEKETINKVTNTLEKWGAYDVEWSKLLGWRWKLRKDSPTRGKVISLYATYMGNKFATHVSCSSWTLGETKEIIKSATAIQAILEELKEIDPELVAL